MQDEKIYGVFEKRLKYVQDFNRKIRDEERLLTDYYHLRDTRHSKWKFTALLTDYCDSIRSRWVNGIFAGDDFFGLEPVEPADERGALIMEAILKHQAGREIKLVQTLKRMIRALSYLGNKFGKTGWDEDKQCPTVIPIDNRYCLVEPTETIESCKWLIAGQKYRYSELLELEEQGLIRDVVRLKTVSSGTSDDSGSNDNKDPLRESRGAGNAVVPKDDDDPEYLLWQMWEDENCWIIEPDSKEVLSLDGHPNPYAHRARHKKPYFQLCSDPEDGMNLGLSPARKLLSKQEELNEVRHLRRRFTDLYIRGIWLGRRESNIDWQKLKKEAILLADEIGDNVIRRLPIGDNILPSIDNEEASILRYCDRHSNIYDPQRGGGGGKNLTDTASGLNLIVQEGNLIFAEQIANIQLGGLVSLVEQMILLNQEYLTVQKAVQITGKTEAGALLSRVKSMITGQRIFDGNFDVTVTSSPEFGSRQSSQKSLSGLTVKYAQDPTVRIRNLKEKEFRAYGLDPEDVMYPEEETDIRVENAQLKQQMAEVQAAEAMPAEEEEAVV